MGRGVGHAAADRPRGRRPRHRLVHRVRRDAAVGARKPNGRGHASPPKPPSPVWRGGAFPVVPPLPPAGRGGGGGVRHAETPPPRPPCERPPPKPPAFHARGED